MVGASTTAELMTVLADTGGVVNWIDHLDLVGKPAGTASIGKLLGKTFSRPYDFDAIPGKEEEKRGSTEVWPVRMLGFCIERGSQPVRKRLSAVLDGSIHEREKLLCL